MEVKEKCDIQFKFEVLSHVELGPVCLRLGEIDMFLIFFETVIWSYFKNFLQENRLGRILGIDLD